MKFEDTNPKRKRAALKQSGIAPMSRFQAQAVPLAQPYELLTFEQVNLEGHRYCAFDVESYPNYFEIGFKCLTTGKVLIFEDSDYYGYCINGIQVTQDQWIMQLIYVLHRWTNIGFNSRSYDMPISMVASQGVRAPMLAQITSEIINDDMAPYEVERRYCGKIPNVNHIDTIEVAPLQASLKAYAARLHCQRLQDLPIPPMTTLTIDQMGIVRDYNINNDLVNTALLANELFQPIQQRIVLGAEYGVDLRSRSDAQIAETVIGSELEKLGVKTKAADWLPGEQFFYQVPPFIKFKTPQFQRALEVVRNTPFTIGASGYADCPKEIEAVRPQLGNNTYRLSAGGLHSSEESLTVYADEDTLLLDRDVASYYPYIILNQGLYPKHLGEPFLKVFRSIVDRRINAKREGRKSEADSLKITINGSFGKLGNPHSKLYSPDLLIQVTVSGQLCLLMLIEMIELADIRVVSANTDGIVINCPKDRYKDLDQVVIIWEEITGFITEETRYQSLHCRDVNNYIAVKEEGGCKTKGIYSNVGSALNSPLSKNPECYIISLAIQAFLERGTPLEETILNHKEFKDFVSVRNVKGGAEKDGVYLGKVVRWYYATNVKGAINYVLTGNKVPKSDGGKPCMLLPETLPTDIDYDRYINDANDELYKLGILKKLATGKLL